MQYLKADTQVKVVIGPVVAVGDGYVPITSLSLSTADEAEILKHDAAAVTSISGNTFAAITSADGYYNLTITAAQLDTEGMLTVLINDDSLCLPVRHDFMVVNANVFDSLFAAATTDYLQVDLLQMGGGAQSATDLKDFADAGYDPGTNKVNGVVLCDTITTYTGNTLQTGDCYARLGSPTSASVSADNLLIYNRLGAPVAASISADIAVVDSVVDDVLADTGTDGVLLTSAANTAIVNAIASAFGATTGTTITGTLSTTQATTDLSEASDDHFNGMLMTFTGGNLIGQQTVISDYDGTSKLLTFDALTEAPVNTDPFIIT